MYETRIFFMYINNFRQLFHHIQQFSNKARALSWKWTNQLNRWRELWLIIFINWWFLKLFFKLPDLVDLNWKTKNKPIKTLLHISYKSSHLLCWAGDTTELPTMAKSWSFIWSSRGRNLPGLCTFSIHLLNKMFRFRRSLKQTILLQKHFWKYRI